MRPKKHQAVETYMPLWTKKVVWDFKVEIGNSQVAEKQQNTSGKQIPPGQSQNNGKQ